MMSKKGQLSMLFAVLVGFLGFLFGYTVFATAQLEDGSDPWVLKTGDTMTGNLIVSQSDRNENMTLSPSGISKVERYESTGGHQESNFTWFHGGNLNDYWQLGSGLRILDNIGEFRLGDGTGFYNRPALYGVDGLSIESRGIPMNFLNYCNGSDCSNFTFVSWDYNAFDFTDVLFEFKGGNTGLFYWMEDEDYFVFEDAISNLNISGDLNVTDDLFVKDDLAVNSVLYFGSGVGDTTRMSKTDMFLENTYTVYNSSSSKILRYYADNLEIDDKYDICLEGEECFTDLVEQYHDDCITIEFGGSTGGDGYMGLGNPNNACDGNYCYNATKDGYISAINIVHQALSSFGNNEYNFTARIGGTNVEGGVFVNVDNFALTGNSTKYARGVQNFTEGNMLSLYRDRTSGGQNANHGGSLEVCYFNE